MSASSLTRAEGTGSFAGEPQSIVVAETDAGLAAALAAHARVAFSTINVVGAPLVVQIDAYHTSDNTASDERWAELLRDSDTYDLLDRMAAEALADDDAGLTLDLDELLS